MNIKTIDINRLNPAKYNPRKDLKPGDQDYESLKHSVEHWGLVDPLIVNENMTVVGGHQRLKVVRDLGYDKVECVMVDLDEANERALNIALNKISGEWDISELLSGMDILKDMDFNIDLTGFSEIDLGGLEASKKRHDAVFKPGQTSITGDIEFIEDAKDALTADDEAQALFKDRSTILVTFSGGKDSSFALLWAKTNFPDKEIIAVFSDTGVELPGMTAHIQECCEFLEVRCEIVKPRRDMWTQILQNGWPSIIYHWCQNLLVYEPINIFYKEYDPADVIVVDGSRADQVTRVCKKTKTSKPSDKRMAQYDYYHPSFDVAKDVLEHILEKSGMPLWEGYSRGFVRTACWMCPGMCGDQALALSENYPGLTEDIRRWERKLGKPLQQSNNRSIDDLINTGLRNRDRRDTQSIVDEQL